MIRATLAGVTVGDGLPVAVMGALNVSPESFYRGSVATRADELLERARAMARAGAALLDVGARSTAPYLETRISPSQEADRLAWAVELLVSKLDLPVSADTSRVEPARAALEAGARVINDVTGLTGDAALGPVVAQRGAGLILMASERGGEGAGSPIELVAGLLEDSLRLAARSGIPAEQIAVDPGIGFFRRRGMPWHEWDCRVRAALGLLWALGRPICVGVSRKSFIGAVAGEADPGDRLPGSLAATAVAVLGGAHVIRAHDVAETVQAVRVAEAIRRARAEA
ncbi:MAG TPA: dihydropteroate synthase [Methylomirabilota bacterium]|nr:dihydropteroate synthase [Methylomirabilota bacterium]